MEERTTTIRLPGAVRRFGHVCAFFHNRDEEYQVLLPLAKLANRHFLRVRKDGRP
jgi:hypothetical protein